MFVELIYGKRNFEGLAGARETITAELTKRIHRIFPDANVRVKPMITLPAINTDASKHEKAQKSYWPSLPSITLYL
ncbi:DinI-like family protein [Raoultella ornithinolytica]|uniref:DinI-like family protein n=1 Tax=Raoultella ornithinolytica TaxID=54291 RepID=UPI003AAE838A